MVAGLDVFCCFVVLDLTLMTTTFGARIFRRAGKSHVGRGVAYTDDCEFPAFQVGGSYIWKKEVCRKSNRAIEKFPRSVDMPFPKMRSRVSKVHEFPWFEKPKY